MVRRKAGEGPAKGGGARGRPVGGRARHVGCL